MEQEPSTEENLRSPKFWAKSFALLGTVGIGIYVWSKFLYQCFVHGIEGMAFGMLLFLTALIFGRMWQALEEITLKKKEERSKLVELQNKYRFDDTKYH
jgi:hypothetical protein